MSLAVNIHPDDALTFFSQYDPLTSLQKQIFRALRWWVIKFPVAFPKQEKIAEHVKCSRKYVNQMIQKFMTYGWVFLTSRGKNRTKILGMPTHLQMMDLLNRQYLKKLEVTSQVTHSSFKVKRIASTEKAGEFSPKLEIPTYLQNTKYSYEDKLKLSLIPENYYRSGVEAVNYQLKKGKSIDDPYSYSVGSAIRMAKEAGVNLNWKLYNQTLNKRV